MTSPEVILALVPLLAGAVCPAEGAERCVFLGAAWEQTTPESQGAWPVTRAFTSTAQVLLGKPPRETEKNWTVPIAPAPLKFEHVFIDEKPPQNPWIKIVGDLNADGRPDLLGANHGGPFQPVELWLNRGK